MRSGRLGKPRQNLNNAEERKHPCVTEPVLRRPCRRPACSPGRSDATSQSAAAACRGAAARHALVPVLLSQRACCPSAPSPRRGMSECLRYSPGVAHASCYYQSVSRSAQGALRIISSKQFYERRMVTAAESVMHLRNGGPAARRPLSAWSGPPLSRPQIFMKRVNRGNPALASPTPTPTPRAHAHANSSKQPHVARHKSTRETQRRRRA